MKLLVVYNEHAAHGKTLKIETSIIHRFQEANVECELLITKYPGHGIELVADANLQSYQGVIAAGGDGTLFEVVTGYFKNSSSNKPPIGILPIGTGNAFSRDMNKEVPTWEEAVDIIVKNKTKKVDVGEFETDDIKYYFLNIIGLGFVADVVLFASKTKWLGNLSYTLGVFNQILFLKADPMTLTLDGKSINSENIFVEVSNTRYTSNFFMAPDAKIDDGYFDVTVLSKTTRRNLLAAFPKIFTGEHIHLDEVTQIKAKKIKIETAEPKVLTPDGELLGSTPVTIQCLHKAIEVFWP